MSFLGGLELLRDFGVYLVGTGRANDRTATAYKKAILTFFVETLPGGVGDVDEQTCYAYLLTLTPNRRNDIAKALVAFFRWADDRGYLPQGNPMRDYRIRRIPPGRVRYLSDQQVRDLFEAAGSYPDLRAFPTLALMLGTGARVGSVVGAWVEDVDLTPGSESIWWRVAKNNRPYRSLLSASHSLPAVLRLAELAAEGYTTGRGYDRDRSLLVGTKQSETVRIWMRRIAKSAAIPDDLAHPHAIRRTFGTMLARGNADLATWVAAMGHSDGSSFIRYAAAEDQRVRAALDRLPVITPLTPSDSHTPFDPLTPLDSASPPAKQTPLPSHA